MELQVYILGLKVWVWVFELETSTSDPKPQVLTQTNNKKIFNLNATNENMCLETNLKTFFLGNITLLAG